jgi:membrane fusion protein (multidrug efflux system)
MTNGIFRKEALQQREGQRREGRLLRITPAWTEWAYWSVLGAVGCALLYCFVGRIGEYAAGPIVVRVEGRTDLTATSEEVVSTVEAQPGQHVAEGQILVRFYGAQEAGELARLDREFELQLSKLLREPSDQAARQALTTLRAQRDLAEARLAERALKAPRAGVVSDVRIRPGQKLSPGEIVLSLVGEDARFAVVAMLPGHYRPLLRAGMPLRLELDGFRYRYQDVVMEEVGDEVVGPAEVRRYLGQEVADAISLDGPVILVRASLPGAAFEADGRAYNYFNGMHGNAEVRVRTKSILVSLIPALEALFPETNG